MKPSITQGTRDFSPLQVKKRQYILNILKEVFELYGFQPIETPAIEKLDTLLGKYSDENDKLLFKILNNGEIKDNNLSDKALRYDLTVPLARYVSMYQNDIAFPFKRYQMQTVWRGDRPQKGRYREFWQCDCDIVGSDSILNEAELLAIYSEVFTRLNLDVTIKINSRKILENIISFLNLTDKYNEIVIILDKLDKIGWEAVEIELNKIGIQTYLIETLKSFLLIDGNNEEKLTKLKILLIILPQAIEGINEITSILNYYNQICDNKVNIVFEPSLARGSDYYTGFIVEVIANNGNIPTIAAGGRYDNLTSLFNLKDVTGVGISFGLDRIYDVMEELNLFPNIDINSKVFITNFGKEEELYSLNILKQLRNNGITCEIYPKAVKLNKQLQYASKRGFEYVIITGENERKMNELTLKNFITGEQNLLTIEKTIKCLKK